MSLVSGLLMLRAVRGIKDSPPYLHDGRLPTLADTVEFFNLVLGLKLSQQEKDALRKTAFPHLKQLSWSKLQRLAASAGRRCCVAGAWVRDPTAGPTVGPVAGN